MNKWIISGLVSGAIGFAAGVLAWRYFNKLEKKKRTMSIDLDSIYSKHCNSSNLTDFEKIEIIVHAVYNTISDLIEKDQLIVHRVNGDNNNYATAKIISTNYIMAAVYRYVVFKSDYIELTVEYMPDDLNLSIKSNNFLERTDIEKFVLPNHIDEYRTLKEKIILELNYVNIFAS